MTDEQRFCACEYDWTDGTGICQECKLPIAPDSPSAIREVSTDYLEWSPVMGGKFVSDVWLRGRRIALHGIEVAFVQNEKGLRMEPVIACAGRLTDLIRANPGDSEFKWDSKEWKAMR